MEDTQLEILSQSCTEDLYVAGILFYSYVVLVSRDFFT